MSQEFDNILDECLERILSRGETVEQCLTRYPEEAAELEPLLRTSLFAKKAAEIKPRPEFRERARYQMRAALQEMTEKRERRFSLFSGQPRWATVVVTVLVLLLASGGTVAAAGNSMPDGPLYPVKLATERVRLALTPSALGKAELYAKLADKRVAEIIKMADKGKPEQAARVADRLNVQLTAMSSLVGPPGEEAGAVMAPPDAPREAPAPTMVERPPEQAPAMMMAPAPAEEKLPEKRAVIVAPPPPAVREAPVRPEAAVEVAGEDADAEDAELDRRAKLLRILARNAATHSAALQAALARAPESARPALLQALTVSDVEYERALRALRNLMERAGNTGETESQDQERAGSAGESENQDQEKAGNAGESESQTRERN